MSQPFQTNNNDHQTNNVSQEHHHISSDIDPPNSLHAPTINESFAQLHAPGTMTGGYLADPAHTLSQMRDGFGGESSMMLSKPSLDGLPSFVGEMSGSPEGSPERKRRRMNGEQQVKRLKYDVLKSFFRIYFKVDNNSMVLKDAIFNLYQRKIPADSRIARNAMYRHMWSFFKDDKISAFQANYREYIKGIKLLTGQEPLNYEGFEKDLEVLSSIGVGNIFDFQEEELAKSSNETLLIPLPGMTSQTHSHGGPHDYLKGENSITVEDELMTMADSIEAQVKALLTCVKDLKSKIATRKQKK